MKKSTCVKCNYEFSNKGGNYYKHIMTPCDGSYKPFVKSIVCKYCNLDFIELNSSEIANHTRWCHENPKRSSYNRAGSPQLNTPEAIKKRSLSIKKAWVDGKYANCNFAGFLNRKHTDTTKTLISQKALASKHRRLVRSIREYVKKDGTVVMLDSSWETALAKRLDEIGVEWVRPKEPIPYTSYDGKTHNYFPDFYLPRYNMYLDPKNPAAVIAQKNKIECLSKIMHNLFLIYSFDDCCNFHPDANMSA